MPSTRLDLALVERGLARSRSAARALVMAGQVTVDGRPADKPGAGVAHAADLAVAEGRRFVSRGGDKLQGALEDLAVDVRGSRALDLGASTGGFTDCLLQAGADEVVAVDVGYGQFDWTLRNDERVHVRERLNARGLSADDLPYAPDLVTCDLAFISVSAVWPAVAPLLAPGWRALVLVKPQFEAGPSDVGKGGVVRDPAVRAGAVRRVARAIEDAGGRACGLVASRLAGPKGNRELVLHADAAGTRRAPFNLDAAIAEVVT